MTVLRELKLEQECNSSGYQFYLKTVKTGISALWFISRVHTTVSLLGKSGLNEYVAYWNADEKVFALSLSPEILYLNSLLHATHVFYKKW